MSDRRVIKLRAQPQSDRKVNKVRTPTISGMIKHRETTTTTKNNPSVLTLPVGTRQYRLTPRSLNFSTAIFFSGVRFIVTTDTSPAGGNVGLRYNPTRCWLVGYRLKTFKTDQIVLKLSTYTKKSDPAPSQCQLHNLVGTRRS